MQLSNRNKGILLLLLSSLGFALISLFIRLAGNVPTMEKTLYRNLVSTFVIAGILLRSGTPLRLPRESRADMFCRCFFGYGGMVLYLWSIDHMGLADANMLNKTSPFFSVLLSIWILGERPSFRDILCIIIAVLGAALVVKPGRGMASFPALIGLFGGFIAGAAYSYVRKVGLHGVPASVTVLCFNVFSCLVSLPFVLMSDTHARGIQIVYLLIVGILAAGVQLSLTKAYRYAPAKEISVFDYSQIIFAALFGFLFWGELPDLLSVAGYAIIIGCAVFRAFF